MPNDDIDKTLLQTRDDTNSVRRSASSIRGAMPVGFISGDRPRFDDETRELLRSRLRAASAVLFVVFAAALVGSIATGMLVLWWARVLTVILLLSSHLVLRNKCELTLLHLRGIELIVFGLAFGQVTLIIWLRIGGHIAERDPTSIAALQNLYLGAWSLLLLTYGIFVPNPWRRAIAILLPISVIPYVVTAMQRWVSPELSQLMAENHASSPVPLPVVAAVVGAFGTHVINAARREAFQARQFGQYRLLDKLGAGGMGEVYKAEHVLLKRPCAMKLIKPSSVADENAIAHFEEEVKATAKLTHWNTVEIYDYGRTEDGTFYYVMELLPGMSLDELVERTGPLPPERVIHLMQQVCGALNEAHATGIIHRDIKPANIFAAQRGGVHDVAKLLDFGLVKVESPQASKQQLGSFSGTPLYMSPEQAASYDDVDGRADLYSLGAVSYFLLTGRPPFRGSNVVELLHAHATAEVVPPAEVDPSIPGDLSCVIAKCLAKKPDDRFASALELERAFEACESAAGWSHEQACLWWIENGKASVPSSNSAPPTAVDAIESTLVSSAPKPRKRSSL